MHPREAGGRSARLGADSQEDGVLRHPAGHWGPNKVHGLSQEQWGKRNGGCKLESNLIHSVFL